jgi:hypothetical protein
MIRLRILSNIDNDVERPTRMVKRWLIYIRLTQLTLVRPPIRIKHLPWSYIWCDHYFVKCCLSIFFVFENRVVCYIYLSSKTELYVIFICLRKPSCVLNVWKKIDCSKMEDVSGWLVGLWCLTPLSTIFQLYIAVAVSFIAVHTYTLTIVIRNFSCLFDILNILCDD